MKILIELPSWLGDTLMATPAIENIISHFDDAQITFIGSKVSIETLKLTLLNFLLISIKF